MRDLVRRGRFCLRHEENDDVAITAVPASVGSSFGQSNPNLDCSPYRGASMCRIPIKSEKRNETNCIRGRFHAVEHAGGYERSGPQQYYGRGRDAIPDDRYDTLSAGRGLMVCQLWRERGNQLRLLFLPAMHGGGFRDRRILHAEWILRVSKLSADAHSTLKSDELARSTKALSARTNSGY